MLVKLIGTHGDYLIAFVRIIVGLVFFAHCAQKMLGWFGRAGFSGTITQFAKFGMPASIAYFAISVELWGSLSLILGFLFRMAAFFIVVEMSRAIATFHVRNGFYMNWEGRQKGEGFEYHLFAIALALVILVRGAGALSIDGAIS